MFDQDPIQTLLDIRAIEQLKHRYMRAIDTHDWDLMATVAAEDIHHWYQDGTYRAQGREAWLQFCRERITFFSSHIATQPEIELTSPTTATGIWRMQDIVHHEGSAARGYEHMNGAGYYYDQYRKEGGRWLIASSGYVRLYRVEQAALPAGERLVTEPLRGHRPAWLGPDNDGRPNPAG